MFTFQSEKRKNPKMNQIKMLFCVLLLFLSVISAYKVGQCNYVDTTNSVKLICSNSESVDECSASIFQNYYSVYYRSNVLHLSTGDCQGNRLNKTLPDIFPNIQTYDVSYHGIDTITSEELNFKNLQIFIASNNRLTCINGTIFVHNPSLVKIHLAHNNITNIYQENFDGATQLTTIILANNRISSVTFEMFSSLPYLTTLNLENNFIKTIGAGAFLNNYRLELLLLNGNPLKRIDCNIFYGGLVSVYVNWTNVKEIDANCMHQNGTLQIAFDSDKIDFDRIILDEKPNYLNYPSIPVKWQRTMEITGHTQNITYFNISGNGIENCDVVTEQLGESVEILDLSLNKFEYYSSGTIENVTFETLHNLKFLNLSHTEIKFIDSGAFANLGELLTLDLSGNMISTLDANTFANNTKLKILQLNDNPIPICDIFSLLMNAVPISSEMILKTIDTSCLENPLQIDVGNDDKVVFRVPEKNFTFSYPKEHFKRITTFKIAGKHLENTLKVVDLLDSSIEELDLSSNFVGPLTAQTFGRFDNLKYLNLSRTNLSNFGFSTFYHQRKLESLDLSFNRLKKVNFTLMYRNFQELKALRLEGNELTEISSVNHEIFPKLSSLGISKNHFSCDYLATFLPQWHRQTPVKHAFQMLMSHQLISPESSPKSFEFVVYPTNQTNIDGIECYHDESDYVTNTQVTTMKLPISNKFNEFSPKPLIAIESKHGEHGGEVHETLVAELRTFKYLLIIMFITLCIGYLVVKSQLIQRIRRNATFNSMENNVAYRLNENNPHEVNLIDQ